jgi:hypothetical protein
MVSASGVSIVSKKFVKDASYHNRVGPFRTFPPSQVEAQSMRMLTFAMACFAAAAATRETPRTVIICTETGTDSALARSAQMTASEIFTQIGLTIRWHSASRCPS